MSIFITKFLWVTFVMWHKGRISPKIMFYFTTKNLHSNLYKDAFVYFVDLLKLFYIYIQFWCDFKNIHILKLNVFKKYILHSEYAILGSESLSGTWCKDILTTIMQHTPHSWSSFTLQCFPRILADFFDSHQVPNESKAQLKRSVEEEYRKWKSK